MFQWFTPGIVVKADGDVVARLHPTYLLMFASRSLNLAFPIGLPLCTLLGVARHMFASPGAVAYTGLVHVHGSDMVASTVSGSTCVDFPRSAQYYRLITQLLYFSPCDSSLAKRSYPPHYGCPPSSGMDDEYGTNTLLTIPVPPGSTKLTTSASMSYTDIATINRTTAGGASNSAATPPSSTYDAQEPGQTITITSNGVAVTVTATQLVGFTVGPSATQLSVSSSAASPSNHPSPLHATLAGGIITLVIAVMCILYFIYRRRQGRFKRMRGSDMFSSNMHHRIAADILAASNPLPSTSYDILSSGPPRPRQTRASLAAGPVHIQPQREGHSSTKAGIVARARAVAGQLLPESEPASSPLQADAAPSTPLPTPELAQTSDPSNTLSVHAAVDQEVRPSSPTSVVEVAPPMYTERPPSPAHTAVKL